MRAFATLTLILSALGGAISLFAIFGGNTSESANGTVAFGSAVGGILMSCVVILLAEIRDHLKARE